MCKGNSHVLEHVSAGGYTFGEVSEIITARHCRDEHRARVFACNL